MKPNLQPQFQQLGACQSESSAEQFGQYGMNCYGSGMNGKVLMAYERGDVA
ncbi:MAG: hypothetical protein JNM76_08155 [Betaproteobacteria bacterium]|nr:hypothetical protein [Betaproteobacteria bacterium]